MTKLKTLEYRVKEKTVYYITRFCEVGGSCSVTEEGQFNDPLSAHRAAKSLALLEAKSWGIEDGDPSLIYPKIEYTDTYPFSDKER